MSLNCHGFLEWKEEFVLQERGNRVVHYFLKDSVGDSVLAVVGTERSIRHMLYVASEEFLQVYGTRNSVNSCFKWRSKREVVDWLTSLLSKQHQPRDCSKSATMDSKKALGSPNFSVTGCNAPQTHLLDHAGRFARKLKGHNSDIVWSGVAWTCGKQLKQYPAFCRNGTTIAIHSFVFVMAKGENHYLAYLEDMYEDKKGQKKVKVRWFHHNQEVNGVIPIPSPHPREVFITPYVKVISAECVDGAATVLTPEHYEKCLAVFSPNLSVRIHMCSRQFRSNRVKPFDLSRLCGYFDQTFLSFLDPNPLTKPNFMCHNLTREEEESSQGSIVKEGAKRTRSCRGRHWFVKNCSGVRVSSQESQITICEPSYPNLKYGLLGRRALAIKYSGSQPWIPPPFNVDEKIELLCQDSGIRGCWFKCSVLQASRKQLKVQYDDVQDEDGCGKLEEWIYAFRLAAPDKLGMRCSGRLTIRPCPPSKDPTDRAFEVGAPVDVWWSDGWWEGVVTGTDNREDNNLQVYFPGEDAFSTFQRKNLRNSRDWVGNRWVDIKEKLDILSAISAAVSRLSPSTKLSTCWTIAKAAESGSPAISDCEVPMTFILDTVQEFAGSAGSNDLENVKWVNSRKRPWIKDKGKGGGLNEENEDNDDAHNYDDGNGNLDMQENFETAG
ncbi:hypothetical protein HHK36_005795 [Tetracentron sinense]|uniref:BAH domain-containing protein n=1 Tax=Tetracentron sinense TaxID=13715 RepID=A0A834ZUY5_TETSI|nr:hypothetical protein HHK36_005795 [Tetracentron sinense]